MKLLLGVLTIFALLLSSHCNAQALVSNREKIELAKKELGAHIAAFSRCVVDNDLDNCIQALVKNADSEYKKYITGGLLYNVDVQKSFQLHHEAYLVKPDELNFNLEYAIELHRKGEYQEAARLYEKYGKAMPDDFRINVWLADCYINTGDIEKSILNWNKSNHPKHHISIDQAINTIYGKTNQVRRRDNYRKEIAKGNNTVFYSLIYLDMNWELDWWNTDTQEHFLNEDIRLLENKLGKGNVDYDIIQTYIKIKKLSTLSNAGDSIKNLLVKNRIIIDGNALPTNGQLASDLLRICFINQLLSEKEFYDKRGQELLLLAQTTKDRDLLNIYAYLQATVTGKVDPAIDKLGWTEFKDERFAVSYFIGKADKNRFDDKELQQALSDFPNSSTLYWVKVNCAKIENIKLREHLVELIKREFKTLGSDPSHYSYPLKSYFGYLSSEK